MRRTPLYEEHVRLGGRMVAFAGWELPVMYTSIIEEHTAVRTAAGIFDVSHMGEITVRGKGAERFLRRVVSTGLAKLSPGRSMYTCLCNGKGGVIDDLFIFMMGINDYYLVVNASTREKDYRWLLRNRMPDVEITDVSEETAKIDLQGPYSREILGRVIPGRALEELKRFHFYHTNYGGGDLLVSQTGYTGELGFELYAGNAVSVSLWRDLLDAGKEAGIRPAGLGARDSLRLEASYSLYGHEVSEEITPLESGLKWVVTSEDDFIGRDALEKMRAAGVPRQLICFELTGRGVPREGCRVEKDGADIGHVTSGSFSPTFKKGLGMALVKSGSAAAGEPVSIVIRDGRVPAVVVKRPFYQYNG